MKFEYSLRLYRGIVLGKIKMMWKSAKAVTLEGSPVILQNTLSGELPGFKR